MEFIWVFFRKDDKEENTFLQMSCMRYMSPEQKLAREDRPYVIKADNLKYLKQMWLLWFYKGIYQRQRMSSISQEML